MSSTVNFYNHNAASFFADTVAVEMSELHARFLSHVPLGGLILDAGCGSGRDSKAFFTLGYRVSAFDASPALAQLASDLIGQSVAIRTFDQVDEIACYDGIWACASLLHLPPAALPESMGRLWTSLKPGGVFYLSFKLGDGERENNGRHFTDATEARLREWTTALADVGSLECWITQDQRPDHTENWLNALIHRSTRVPSKLITGGRDHPFLPQLCESIAHR